MMRSRPLHKLRSYLLPAIAAIFLAVGPVACSSSGEDGAPNPALEGAASGEEASGGNANGAGSENSNAAATNANTESTNTAKPEGESAAANNPIGNELNNAIANDKGGGGNGSNAEEGGGAINTEANSAGTTPAGGGEAPAAAADANAGNPFAAPANNAPPMNAAPSDLGAASAPPPADAAAPADAGTAAAPVDAGAAAPADTGAAAAPADAGAAAPAAGAPAAGGEASAAAAPSGPTSLPEMGSKMAYYVMRGDTLGAIAQKIYGSRKKWKALQSENGLADANKIYPGDVIYFTLNESSKAFAEKYEVGNRQAHTVVKGDTLARLAAKFYGTQGAWRALWKENPQVLNPDRLRVGTVLSYRAMTKVALKDEEEDQEKDASEDQTADNESGDESGVVMAEPAEGQFTAALE